MMTLSELRTGAAVVAVTVGLGAGVQAQTLEYWVYSDFAQGEAGALQNEFIQEFIAEHPGVTINISGRGDDDLTAGQIAGAASGTTPDVFMNGLAVGAQLVEVGALANIYDRWMAMPQEYRDQFDPAAIERCMAGPEELYCLPYTGYGSLMFRNLTVLEQAGIDPADVPATWAEWLEQMQAVSDAGLYAIPDQTLVFNSIAEMYGMFGSNETWGIDWETRTTRIDPAVMTQALQAFVDMAELNSGTSRNDQATKDLFTTNQLAFHTIGPWVNPSYLEAQAQSGLHYDYVLIPGAEEGRHGGIQNYEFIGIAPGENEDLAWEFASYVAEKDQMLRWAALLSRYNSNTAAMQDPSVSDLPLIARSVESVSYAMDAQPPYFVQPVPNCYLSTVVDVAAATADGDYTPEEGAAAMIDELNACLAE